MIAVASDLESGDGEYTRPPIEGRGDVGVFDGEIADGAQGKSTDRLRRQLGEGPTILPR